MWEVMNTRAEKPQDCGKLTRRMRGPVAVRNAALRRGAVPEIVWRSRRGWRRLALSHACRITPRRTALSYLCRLSLRRTALSRPWRISLRVFPRIRLDAAQGRPMVCPSALLFSDFSRNWRTAPTDTANVPDLKGIFGSCAESAQRERPLRRFMSRVQRSHLRTPKVRARDLRSNRDAALRVLYRGRYGARRGATEVAVGGASTRGSRMNQKWSRVLLMRDPGITSSQLVLLLSESVQDLKVPE